MDGDAPPAPAVGLGALDAPGNPLVGAGAVLGAAPSEPNSPGVLEAPGVLEKLGVLEELGGLTGGLDVETLVGSPPIA